MALKYILGKYELEKGVINQVKAIGLRWPTKKDYKE